MESPTAVEVWRNNNKHASAAAATATATVTNPNPNRLARLFPILFTFQFQPNPFLTMRENSPVKSNLNTASIMSAADRCLHMFTEFASCNPLLVNLFSIPSNFRNFLQIGKERNDCRRNWSPLVSSNHNFAAILPGDSVAGVVVSNGVMNFLNIYNTLLVVRLVLTWFPNSPPAIVSPLSTLCDPYLNIFRGIIPPLGGLDLSPILAFLVLNAFTSTAAALPAELPSSTTTITATSAHPYIPLPKAITSSQEKWLKRMHSTTSSNGGHETETETETRS